MEFDSEEERGIFGNDDDDEEMEMESYFSSDENEGFLNVKEQKDTTEVIKETEPISTSSSTSSPQETSEAIREEQQDIFQAPCSTDSTSKSTTPSDTVNSHFFNEDGANFTDELIDNAASLITLPTTKGEKDKDSLKIEDDSDEDEVQSSHASSSRASPLKQEGGVVPAGDTRDTSLNLTDSEDEASMSDTPKKHFVQRAKGQQKAKKNRSHLSNRPIAKKHRRRCGECPACLIESDCGVCRFCKDMRKYGGPGKLRQKCITRQCIKLSRVLYTEDPLVSRGETQLQEDMKCELERVSALPIQDKPIRSSTLSVPRSVQDTAAILAQSILEQKSQLKPVKKLPPVKKPPAKKATGGHQSRKKVPKRPRSYIDDIDDSDDDEIYTFGGSSSRRRPLSALHSGWGRGNKGGSGHQEKQCEGPECVYSARPHSKYCSDECGIQLALRRIETYLPKQKELWNQSGEPLASQTNKEKLKEFDREQEVIKQQLKALDKQTALINEHVVKMKKVSPHKPDSETDDCDDLTVHCATCSQLVGLKKAQLHMERCFTRLEGMVSFGSIVKNEGTDIFCDKFDRSQGNYCKRLRVLCPEHTKEPKVGPQEVCGCPLEPQFPFKLSESKSYCRNLKKSCFKHYSWEKLRRAEIDQEKLNLFLKQEELNEQARLIQWQLNYRSSLLSIMLHHTLSHTSDDNAV